MGVLSTLLGLMGCDPQAWEEERKRLQPENFDKIKAGMLEMEVIQILGKPHQMVTYALKPQELNYHWRWRNSANDAMLFSTIFDPDKVVIRTESALDPQDPKNQNAS